MKRNILSLIIALISFIVGFASSHGIDNPLYLGIILIDQPDLWKMEEICECYNLKEVPMEDGYRIFHHSDGTELRCGIYNVGDKYYPIVKVSTNKSSKEIDQLLNGTGYVKESGAYYKGTKFARRRTKCSVSGHSRKTLTFEKEYNDLP